MDNASDAYRTVLLNSEGIYKEKGSKFIGLVFPVLEEKEVKEILKQLKSKYHDARHHCYGFRLGADLSKFRFSDDGEPSGTAGKPIFGQIKSFELTNILIVVVRYFGGTKLGVGGLISAYREAAKQAILNNQITQKHLQSLIELEFEYSNMNGVMRMIKELQATVLEQEFEERCSIRFSIRMSQQEAVLAKLNSLHYKHKLITDN